MKFNYNRFLQYDGLDEGIPEVERIMQIFDSIPGLFGDRQSKKKLALDLLRSKNDSQIVEFDITACPDYSYDRKTSKFTLKNLNQGMSLVSRLVTKAILPVLGALNNLEVPISLNYIYADIESENPYIREKMGVSEEVFLEATEQSEAMTTITMRKFISMYGLEYINADVGSMSTNYFTKENERLYSPQLDSIPQRQIDELYLLRKDTLLRMYKSIIPANISETDFVLERVKRDIFEHLLLGSEVRKQRLEGIRKHIITMSIPHLARYLNYQVDSTPRAPVLRVEKKY